MINTNLNLDSILLQGNRMKWIREIVIENVS